MNTRVREFLIEIARANKTTDYSEVSIKCGLGLNFNNPNDQNEIGVILDQISSFEYNNGRPMLSVLVFYKGQTIHGGGFFSMAARETGKSKGQLRDELFEATELKRCYKFWQNKSNYSQFSKLRTNQFTLEDYYYNLVDEYDWAEEWAENYESTINTINELRKRINNNQNIPLTDNILYNNLSRDIKSYADFIDHWIKNRNNGIASRGQSNMSNVDFKLILDNSDFNIYVREILFNPSFETYNKFRGWWYSISEIYNRPLLINRVFAACNTQDLTSTVDEKKFYWVVNYLSDKFGFQYSIENSNWYLINSELTKWLDTELKSVFFNSKKTELQKNIWRNIFVWLIYDSNQDEKLSPNSLTKTDRPEGVSEIPKKVRTYQGYSDIDFESNQAERKYIGDAGEALVIELEKTKLRNAGLLDKVDKVIKLNDGKGYDILSFDEKGNKIHIEVKTTPRGVNEPFYLSENEIGFMNDYPEMYFIYRIYEYDDEFNTGKYFILNNVKNQIFLEPTNYRVYLSNNI